MCDVFASNDDDNGKKAVAITMITSNNDINRTNNEILEAIVKWFHI